MIGGGGTQHNQIDIRRLDTSRLQCSTRGLFGQVAGSFARRGDMAFLNTGPFDNPIRRGVDHPFEIGVGEDFFRQIAASSNDSGVVQRACLSA